LLSGGTQFLRKYSLYILSIRSPKNPQA
jgi:hypothetical protein